MSRKSSAQPRKVVFDPICNNEVVAKFTNYIMQDGKKDVARKIVKNAFEVIDEQEKGNPLDVFLQAVENVCPEFEVCSKRVGGATYRIPVEVRRSRGIFLALNWIIAMARTNSGKTFYQKLAAEILDAYHERGKAIKKCQETHKEAEQNKAFSHYRW